MKVAIVHYWLVGMRGGEKVVEQLCRLFPDADIYTHVYSPKHISKTIAKHRVFTTSIQSMPFSRRLYSKYVSFMPAALERLDLSAYDIVISSEAGPAKGVITRPDALHICYCHSPMRYMWDQYGQYFKEASPITRLGMELLSSSLRQWDVTSASRVDHFIANSKAVARRIEKFWRRDAEVIAPPVDVRRFEPTRERGDFYLYVGEFVAYKRADIAIEACSRLERRLVVIGDGKGMQRLRNLAGPTVEFLGRVPNQILADHYSQCKALLFPAEEDFGIVPVEAMAAGAPVLAFNRGGARDYVREGENGIFFSEQTAPAVMQAMIRLEDRSELFSAPQIAESVRAFDTSHFIARIQASILSQLMLRKEHEVLARKLRDRWRTERMLGALHIPSNGGLVETQNLRQAFRSETLAEGSIPSA